MKTLVQKAVRTLGYDIVRCREAADHFPADVPAGDREILRRVAGYTMTSVERQCAVIEAARHIARAGVPGCFVECGVWRGGSTMAAALALAQEGDTGRDLYLYDTFEGMTPPTDADLTADNVLASTLFKRQREANGRWCYAGIEDVRENLAATGYPRNRVHLVKGPVEQTIPAHSPPPPIALLRLDTDWYESTRHEMTHLFPLLAEGGVLIIDDYGHWQGARKAIDEYLAQQPKRYYLHRIDYTGRLLVKQ